MIVALKNNRTNNQEIGKDLLETADAIIQIANNNVVDTLRTVLLERDMIQERDFSLVAFGAGPLHVNELIELEGIPTGIVPLHPGQFSALGFTMTDAQVDEKEQFNNLRRILISKTVTI